MEEAEGQTLAGEYLGVQADGMGSQGRHADHSQDRRFGGLPLLQAPNLVKRAAQIEYGSKQGRNQGSHTSLKMIINNELKCRISKVEDKALAAYKQTPMYTTRPDRLNPQSGCGAKET